MTGIIATDAQLLTQDARVEMFELDLTHLGGEILRFCPTSVAGVPVTFNTYVYQPYPIQAEGFSWSGSGTLARPTLSIGVKDMAFMSLIMSTEDLVGAEVRRLRTYRKYLDDGAFPNPTAMFPMEVYRVNKKAQQTKNVLVFELTPKMDQEGRMIPALQVIRDTCRHRFRKWNGAAWDYTGVTCPYAGEEMYDVNDLQTLDPYQGQCGHKLSSCSVHFGPDAVLPIRAFPGVGRVK